MTCTIGYYRAGQQRLRRLQRKLARSRRGSAFAECKGQNRRKRLLAVQRQHEHVANQRADFMNKLAHTVVQQYDGIPIEDLRIGNMVCNHHRSKSILDSGWGHFRERLTHKAANAGRQLAFIDPVFTSKACSNCGAIFEHLTLADRWVQCDCGLSLDRGYKAAKNVLSRAGWDTSVQRNVVPLRGLRQETRKRKRAAEAMRL